MFVYVLFKLAAPLPLSDGHLAARRWIRSCLLGVTSRDDHRENPTRLRISLKPSHHASSLCEGAGVNDAAHSDDTAMNADHAHAQRNKQGTKEERAAAKHVRAIMQRSFEGAVAAATAAPSRVYEAHTQHAEEIARGGNGRSQHAQHRSRSVTPPRRGGGPDGPLDTHNTMHARDAKREEREMLFAKHHVDVEEREAFGCDGTEASGVERSSRRHRAAQQAQRSPQHHANKNASHASRHVSQPQPQGGVTTPRGGRERTSDNSALPMISPRQEMTRDAGGRSPRGTGLVGPHAVGGVDADGMHVMNDNEVRWRRKERDAKLKEMFDARKELCVYYLCLPRSLCVAQATSLKYQPIPN